MSVCAQHYHINRLRTLDGGGHWIDLRNFDAMFFPVSKSAAIVTITQHAAVLAGMPAPHKLVAGWIGKAILLEAIEYTVTACANGNGFVTEDFLHKFKRKPRFGPRGSFYFIQSEFPLFTTRPLDDMLSTRAFGSVQGAQFCC